MHSLNTPLFYFNSTARPRWTEFPRHFRTPRGSGRPAARTPAGYRESEGGAQAPHPLLHLADAAFSPPTSPAAFFAGRFWAGTVAVVRFTPVCRGDPAGVLLTAFLAAG